MVQQRLRRVPLPLPMCRPDRLKLQTDHLQPLCIPAGQDRFRDIGRARGGAGVADASAVAEGLREWEELLARTFPAKGGKMGGKGKLEIPEQYNEEGMAC